MSDCWKGGALGPCPGLALLMYLCRTLADDGVTEVHLGPGDYQFKAHLSSWQFPILRGFAGAGAAGFARRAAAEVERRCEHLPVGPVRRWPGKAFRRLDVIAGFRAA